MISTISFTQTGGGGWLNWLYRKGKNEAHLPDDKNKSVSYSSYMCMSYYSVPLYSVSHFCIHIYLHMTSTDRALCFFLSDCVG